MAREEGKWKRPFKLWDSWRNVRKGLVVSSLDELLARGKEKLGVGPGEPARLVLEADGTQVDDGDYFRTLPSNTVLLLLRPGERWYPSGVDVIRAAISAIPKIVCETIHALELHDETPSWKIMDNKGRVTVVLHWDPPPPPPRPTSNQLSCAAGLTPGSLAAAAAVAADPSSPASASAAPVAAAQAKYSPSKKQLVIQTSVEKVASRKESVSDGYSRSYQASPSPQITVINHDEILTGKTPTTLYQPSPRLVKQGSSFESASVHVHTPECANHAHRPRSSSPGNSSGAECDFHCCALHEEGRRIAVHKSVATSPIQDPAGQGGGGGGGPGGGSSRGPAGPKQPGGKQQHVRFVDTDRDSSESEADNTVLEEEHVTTDKFLLLIDQLSADQKRHLTIKDIGIILERLSSKIVDVERLDRESESEDCFNWTIKATIRGDVLRELGVIYNGNYYAISEHPGYKEEESRAEEQDDDDEQEDRL